MLSITEMTSTPLDNLKHKPLGFVIKSIPVEPVFKKAYGHYLYKVVVDGSRIVINSLTGEEAGPDIDIDNIIFSNDEKEFALVHTHINKWIKENVYDNPEYEKHWLNHGIDCVRIRWEKDRTIWFYDADTCKSFVNAFHRFIKTIHGPRYEDEAKVLQDCDIELRPHLWLHKYRYKIEFKPEYFSSGSAEAEKSQTKFDNCVKRLGNNCRTKQNHSISYRGPKVKRILYAINKKDLGVVTLSLGAKISTVTKAVLFEDYNV